MLFNKIKKKYKRIKIENPQELVEPAFFPISNNLLQHFHVQMKMTHFSQIVNL